MKVIVFMWAVVYLVLLLNTELQEALALSKEQNYHSGAAKWWNRNPRKMARREESKKVPSLWMAQDYSVVRRRRHVHNDLKP